MNILDENIGSHQVKQLRTWRIAAKKIGVDLARRGMQDTEIIPFLHQLSSPTFFSHDDDFYKPQLCHDRYCLVNLAVGKYDLMT